MARSSATTSEVCFCERCSRLCNPGGRPTKGRHAHWQLAAGMPLFDERSFR